MAWPASREASFPNPKLQPFGTLVGEWITQGTHPLVPGVTFHGRASFEWIEGGAFLLMRTEIQEPQIPTAVAIIGSDDAAGTCHMLYFDERGVSRMYEMSMQNNVWMWWRNAPDLSQRFRGEISGDARVIVAKGEMSKDGARWSEDLSLTYSRVR